MGEVMKKLMKMQQPKEIEQVSTGDMSHGS
jgi:hypothetical protein